MKRREVDGSKLFRGWLEKNERRVRKIKENPDPALFKGNLLLYEMMRDYFKRELEAWESGKPMPVLYASGSTTHRLWMACGFHTYVLDCFGDYLSREQVLYYLQLVRRLGFPENSCDRVQALAAIGISGHIPPPSSKIRLLYGKSSLKSRIRYVLCSPGSWEKSVDCFKGAVLYKGSMNRET